MGLNLSRLCKIVLPSRIRVVLPDYLLKAGITKIPYDIYGGWILASFFLNFAIWILFFMPKVAFSILALLLYSSIFLVFFELVLLVLLFFLFKLKYDIIIYDRTKQINSILPDFLEALRNNLAAGQSFNRALMNSLHPNFKILNEEIEIVAKKASTGEDIEQALQEFSSKYVSPLVEESVDILVLALEGGANIVEILDKLIESIRIDRELKEEVRISVSSYIMFISMISVVISPILFALSLNMLNIFSNFTSKLGATQLGSVSFSKAAVSSADFILFSQTAVIIIALFSGLIVAKLKKGSIKGFLPQIALFVILSVVFYELARFALSFVFSSIA